MNKDDALDSLKLRIGLYDVAFHDPNVLVVDVNPDVKVTVTCKYDNQYMKWVYEIECVFPESFKTKTWKLLNLNRMNDNRFVLDLIDKELEETIKCYKNKSVKK